MSRTITYPDRAAWLAARREGIGSSEAAILLAASPWLSPYALWAQKLGLMEPAADTEAMQWGIKLEPLIAEAYAEATGRQVSALPPWTVHVSDTHAWQRATLDRVLAPIDARGPGVLELKSTGTAHAGAWEEGAPHPYLLQVQHQLAVTGWQWGSLAVLIGGQQLRWVDVARDEACIAALTAAEAAFWQRLLDRDPPPVDGRPSTLAALAARYPREAPGSDPVALPPEADAWDAQRAAALETIKAGEGLKAEAEAHLKALIGDAPAGLLPGGVTYTWRTQTRAAYTVAASEARVLRRSAASRRAV
jgi:putative phage-type endonuclease